QFNGDGLITRSAVEGGGVFNFVIDTSPIPKTIESSGIWKATRLTNFTLIGEYGAIAAGILQMDVHLVQNQGPVLDAKLRVVCSIASADLDAGEPEGYVLGFVPVITRVAFHAERTNGGVNGALECLALAPRVPTGPDSGTFDVNVMYVTGSVK